MRSKLLIVAGLATSMLLLTAASASAHGDSDRYGQGEVVVVNQGGGWVQGREGRWAEERREGRWEHRRHHRRMMRRALHHKNQTIARVNAKCARVDARFYRHRARRICERTITRAVENHNAVWGRFVSLSRWDFAGLPTRVHYRPPTRPAYGVAPAGQVVWRD